MARKNSSGSGRKGAIIRLSVGLSEDVWMRAKALSLLRRQPLSDIVADLVATAVQRVRLPSEGAEASPNDHPG
jgi:hypothetical protein